MGHVVSIDSEDLKSIAKQVNEIDNRTTGMEAMFPQFVETQKKTNEILVQLAVKGERDAATQETLKQYGKRLDINEAKISHNEKLIAKWVLICTIAFGLLATYFPELKSIVGL
jgi:hypothetical protein